MNMYSALLLFLLAGSVFAVQPPTGFARHLTAKVVSSAGLAVPANQRAPFGWQVTTITTADKPPLVLKWDNLPAGVRPTHLRITAGLDERDDKEVEVVLAQSGRKLGKLEVRFAAQYQPYQLALAPADIADLLREGVALRLLKGSDLEIFTCGGDVPAELLPHLLVPGGATALEEFHRRMRSMAVVQQYGWMEGCVLDGLLDLGDLPGGDSYRAAAELHLAHFIRDGHLVYESPRSAPSDDRVYGIEGTLPFAALARLRPADPLLELPVEAWKARRRPNGSIQDGDVMSSEGTYTIAYPMALIAKARGDEALMRDALTQCRLRQAAFFNGNEFCRTVDEAGKRGDRNWARGIAWQLLGLVRTLEVAKDRQDIDDLIAQLRALSQWTMKHQRGDGLWSVVVTETNLTPDTSGSAGIAAALAKGVRLGWLPAEAKACARRTYDGLQPHLTADGFLGGASQSNKGGPALQRSDYRVLYQMGMGLLAQLEAALERK